MSLKRFDRETGAYVYLVYEGKSAKFVASVSLVVLGDSFLYLDQLLSFATGGCSAVEAWV